MAAKASLHSTASNSSTFMPERSSSLWVTGTGAESTMAASSAATAKWAKRARIGRPSASATERSAMSMAAAPSVVCDELPAVMSGAVSGSQCWAGGSAASASSVELRRMPSSDRRNSPVRLPSSALIGTAMASRAEVPVVPALGGPAVRLERVGVHLLPGDPVAVGQDLAHPELRPEAAVDLPP